MVTLLAELLPVKALLTWAARLIMLGVLLLLFVAFAVGIGGLLWSNPAPYHPRTWAVAFAPLYLGWKLLRAWLRGRGYVETGERTIDGKVVPEKLAVAALDVPSHSPDGDYVLRGVPEYGKTLLKLDPSAYAYVPEVETEPLQELLAETLSKSRLSAVIHGWIDRGRLRRPGMTAAAVVLVAIVVIAVATRHSESARARSFAPIVEGQIVQTHTAPTATTEKNASDSNPPSIAEITASIGSGDTDTSRSTARTNSLKEQAKRNLDYALSGRAGPFAPVNLRDALDNYRAAAEQGDAEAKYMQAFATAKCYELPCYGFELSTHDAEEWYQKVVANAPASSTEYLESKSAIERLQGSN